MGKDSKIVWCEHTFNPWIGCYQLPDRPGCNRCYAASMAEAHGWDNWGMSKLRRITSASTWSQPEKWNQAAMKAGRIDRVFLMSLGDFLEDRPELVEPRRRVVEDVIPHTPNLEWLILTKRIDNAHLLRWPLGWPSNVRLGITVENQAVADRDIPKLLRLDVPNFVSVEPMLGPVVFAPWDLNGCREINGGCVGANCEGCRKIGDYQGIDWIICGAESAPGKRAGRHFDPDWARGLRDQARDAGIPFTFKQGHENGRAVELPELDGKVWNERPVR